MLLCWNVYFWDFLYIPLWHPAFFFYRLSEPSCAILFSFCISVVLPFLRKVLKMSPLDVQKIASLKWKMCFLKSKTGLKKNMIVYFVLNQLLCFCSVHLHKLFGAIHSSIHINTVLRCRYSLCLVLNNSVDIVRKKIFKISVMIFESSI